MEEKNIEENLSLLVFVTVNIILFFLEIDGVFKMALVFVSSGVYTMFNTRKRTGKEKKYEGSFNTNNLRYTEVLPSRSKDFHEVFLVYLNEFVQNHNFTAFKDALLEIVTKNEFDIESNIKYFEFLKIYSEKNIANTQRRFNFQITFLAIIISLFAIFVNDVTDIEKYFSVYMIAFTFIYIKVSSKIYMNPYDLLPLFYKHCLDVLKEKNI